MENVSVDNGLRQQEISCRKDLIAEKIGPDEYFALLLSILGDEKVIKGFPAIVREIAVMKPQLYNPLLQLYETYQAQAHGLAIEAGVGNRLTQPRCSLDEELDLELAIQLSLNENGLGGSDIYEPIEADMVSYAGCDEVSEPQWPKLNQTRRGRGRGVDLPSARQTVERRSGGWSNDKNPGLVNLDQSRIKQNDDIHTLSKGFSYAGAISKSSSINQTPTIRFIGNKRSPIGDGATNGTSLGGVAEIQNVSISQDPMDTEIQSSTNAHTTEDLSTHEHGANKKKKRKKKKGGSIPRTLCNKPVIFWFRKDLRIYDNPALLEASLGDAVVIPVFLWSEVEEGPLAAGGATKLWLHHALQSLNNTFQDRFQSQILFKKTDSCLRELQALTKETGARTIVWNDLYEPCLKKRDDAICATMQKAGISVKRYHSYLLYEPGVINMETVGLRGLGSVTHFMEACRQSVIEPISHPVDPPSGMPHPDHWPSSEALNLLGLARMPQRKDGSIIDWAAPIVAAWDFSEDAAYAALQLFLTEAVRRYDKESGRSDLLNTCRVSPYLHFGQISPRTVLAEAKHSKCNKFLRKLAWRDLSYFLLDMFPTMDSEPLRPPYKHQRWSNNKRHLAAWQRGRTGYPLVDAAMRQLWATGWMNNYMRHVVASFLISYLHLHWIEGYKWFQDTLVDADVAINAMMWQNGGMSGLDHWNFVMHPVDAAMTCDPRGTYVRRWVPELASLPDDYVCQPWKCPPSILRRAGIQLGLNYPERILTNLEDAREQSLKDAVNVRLRHGGKWVDPRTGNDLVPLSSGLLLPVITRKEFKYKTSNPDAQDNPYSAVLHGYRSRKRDEAIAFANQVDFLSSTMNECVLRSERAAKTAEYELY